MSDRNPPMWNLSEGVEFARSLSAILIPVGFDVALAGSVLKRGQSFKDLDLVVYPLNTSELIHHWVVCKALRSGGGVLIADQGRVTESWRKKGSSDTKHVEIWRFDGRRVDLLFLK